MARPTKSEDEKLGPTIAFRLRTNDFHAYKKKVAASGMSQSEFFRLHVLGNTTQVLARPVASPDAKRAVFLLHKASNNLNQLAHRANVEHVAGKLSESSFLSIIGQLKQLNEFMLEQTVESTK